MFVIIPIKLHSNGIAKLWVEVINIKQSKCYLLLLVLVLFDFSHKYLYQLLINCLCRVLLLAPPKILEKNYQNFMVA